MNTDETTQEPLVGLANEIDLQSGDGWALLSPYGEWPHADGLQRFGRPEAEQMVKYFKTTWNRIKRAVVGQPIYRGHPDMKSLANQYPDKTTYGSIADLEARDDGLWFRPILTPDGARQVESGAKFVSPHWLANSLPSEGGRRVFAPVFLVSVGLTSNPNIPGKSLVNSKPEEPMTLLAQLIATLALANEATEADVVTHVAALAKRPEPTALANEQTARTTAEGRVAELTAKLAEAQTALANERAAFAGAREALVNEAVKTGRIAEANKATWLNRLERDFAAEATALANEKAALKTAPVTAQLGERKAANTARDQFVALVNERVGKGEPWDAAWQSTKKSPQGAALYDEMQKPSV